MGTDRGACGRPSAAFGRRCILTRARGRAVCCARRARRASTPSTPQDTDRRRLHVLDCTLREAINAANATAGPDVDQLRHRRRRFLRRSPRPRRCPRSPTRSSIDATTQTGLRRRAADHDSTAARRRRGTNGLSVAADRSTIQGLAITSFDTGIVLERAADGVTVGATTSASTRPAACRRAEQVGIERLLVGGNTVGGSTGRPTATSSREHAGRHRHRRRIDGAQPDHGNYVGTDAAGTFAVAEPLRHHGPRPTTTSSSTNLVSGNTDRGVQLDGASNNTLTSNLHRHRRRRHTRGAELQRRRAHPRRDDVRGHEHARRPTSSRATTAPACSSRPRPRTRRRPTSSRPTSSGRPRGTRTARSATAAPA